MIRIDFLSDDFRELYLLFKLCLTGPVNPQPYTAGLVIQFCVYCLRIHSNFSDTVLKSRALVAGSDMIRSVLSRSDIPAQIIPIAHANRIAPPAVFFNHHLSLSYLLPDLTLTADHLCEQCYY